MKRAILEWIADHGALLVSVVLVVIMLVVLFGDWQGRR